MKNKIMAYVYDNFVNRVIPVDSPIVKINTSAGEMTLPMHSRIGTLTQIFEEMQKHAVVYLYEAEVYQEAHKGGDLIKIRWGWIE
ncbi:hypothetical protein JC221_129 [Yersinia phage JC221]|nr:hypothetical protein JC221_129 [Yersinia phage JC221]